MKCEVKSCANNKDSSCLKVEDLVLSDCGEGLHCNCYIESRDSKLALFKIIDAIIDGKEEVIIMSLAYKSVSYVWDVVFSELETKYTVVPSKLIVDNTLVLGTKSKARYCKIDSFTSDCGDISTIEWDFKIIEDKDVLRQLKEVNCKEILSMGSTLGVTVLNSVQEKMILKGIVI